MEKIIAIECESYSDKEIHGFQSYLFDRGYQWVTSKYKGERKFKKQIDILIIEGTELYNGTQSTLNDLDEEGVKIIFFNSPVEYLRHYKIKKIKTKIK